MRLFNVHTLQLESFFGKQLPRYAILSHRWGPDDEELTFRDVQANNLDKPGIGSVKLRGCIAQAKDDKLDYIWVDTFCINKADDATELTKAINSMFAWYRGATVCYAYLCDVVNGPLNERLPMFCASQWFRRGWTLQELLAPRYVRFYTRQWSAMGTKHSMSAEVEKATGISAGFLEGVWQMDDASVAQRMSWAAGRVTREPEDIAYSLLGILGVNMPLIYGEGGNAFIRLQEEISKKVPDDSILAWGMRLRNQDGKPAGNTGAVGSIGILASSPADFLDSGNITSSGDPPSILWSSGAGSLGIEMALHTSADGQCYGLLHCHAADDSDKVVGIPLQRSSSQRSDEYVRSAGCCPIFLPVEAARKSGRISPAAPIRIRVSPSTRKGKGEASSSRFWIKGLHVMGLQIVETFPTGCWDASTSTITAPDDDPAWNHIWLRLRKDPDNDSILDFILVLSSVPTTQDGQRPARSVGVGVCSRLSRLPTAHYRGGAPNFDPKQSDNTASAYVTLSLRQSQQFIGAKSTHVIELAAADEDCPHYVDLTSTFSRMDLEAGIIGGLELCDDMLRARADDRSIGRFHEKHIKEVESSMEMLDQAIARLQGLRGFLDRDRERMLTVRGFEGFQECLYEDEVSEREEQIVGTALQMMNGGDEGISTDNDGQAADALFELIIGHVSGVVELKRPAAWTPRQTAVYLAACCNESGVMEFLKRLGGDLETALLWCTQEDDGGGIGTLLDAGASPEGPKDCPDPPLMLAVIAGNEGIVEMLLDHGASLDVVDKEGRSPVEVAAALGHGGVERQLNRFTIERQDKEGRKSKVGKALDQIRWCLGTDDKVMETYKHSLRDAGYDGLLD
ncbi:hypothetical protein B0T11DRAFT_287334 [Plectosphaerella cucumerina]|uniref:Heterokaryon incompatibility domain-containing protein n=1 Tax=Plectosphaerella cucumerina TaxID=40658 RepID=A0A8K0TE28_9PEZI|nr:hypothetical protein B0T11DRAFT_287334 [Plectosphaerella cucumerina]